VHQHRKADAGHQVAVSMCQRRRLQQDATVPDRMFDEQRISGRKFQMLNRILASLQFPVR